MSLQTKRWERQLSGKPQREFDLFQWADIFMHEYGMNWNDFISLKVPTFWMLCKAINRRYEEEAKQMKKTNKKGRR